MSTSFILEYWKDDGWFVGRLRGIPGIFSQGKTVAELEANIRDAYCLMTEEQQPPPKKVRTKKLAIKA